ncbi:acyl-CoA dehydrogenase family protein [Kytococcus schroeteri]|uniref:acyl-CoA dehydrogenase family protein n=1 Tax=Kytococcus schroeteri TaxID=138300 RepID=UPI001141868C|nr:acyl-CoA dehydrogenase family protein [Kytococcus schroeteri]
MTTLAERTHTGTDADAGQHAALLEAAAEHAGAVDRGERPAFTTLAEHGGTALTLGRGDATTPGDLREQVAVLRATGARCLSTAFSLWGHRMGVEYLDAAGALLPEGVEDGATPLSSAMAPLFKSAAGLGEVPVVGTPLPDGGLRLDGRMPWASNLLPGGEVLLPVRLEEEGGAAPGGSGTTAGPALAVVRVAIDDPRLSVRPLSGLTALEATASGSLALEGVEVGPERVLTRDAAALRERVTTPFLAFQSAFCLGLCEASLAASAEFLAGPESAVFADDHAALSRELEELTTRLEAVAAAPAEASRRELVRLRLAAAHLTGSTTTLERRVAGGRGFTLRSATSRRVREAEFLPVQSPTEGHLRVLLNRLEEPA